MTKQISITLNKGFEKFARAIAKEHGESVSMVINSIIHSGIDEFCLNPSEEIGHYRKTQMTKEVV
jgi:hypothetical protein